MNTTHGVGELLRRMTARNLLCYSIMVAALYLSLTTALHPHPLHPAQGKDSWQSSKPHVAGEDDQSSIKNKIYSDTSGETVGKRLDPPLSIRAKRFIRSLQHPSEHHFMCLVKSSCSSRDSKNAGDLTNKFPCICDDECYRYGDCCYDHESVSRPAPDMRPACKSLTPIAGRTYSSHRTVFLVNRCPVGTEPQLMDRCEGKAPPNHLIDTPVFSTTSGIGYSNIFCATCHNDSNVQHFNMSVSCIGNVHSTFELENMTYHAGELRWTSPANSSGDYGVCFLDVAFPPSIGRWCQSQLVDTCREDWPIKKHVRRCGAYNYYVQTNTQVYKNRDCALCNGVPPDKIKCLSLFRLTTTHKDQHPPSLIELFEWKGDCKNDEVWDPLYRRCEHVSCGFLFTLVHGKCERSNETMPRDGHSYLEESCYAIEYRQNLTTHFPNHSIYLSETQRLYHFGEYEFNGPWVRVCDQRDNWTPAMFTVSSVLIVFSLVCLLLHMAIFIALPEKRTVPSKNLFSMSVSLFMAEFLFVTFFQIKINHVTCVISGLLMYYFLCVSFLWMNVMSIDICRTFYSPTHQTRPKRIFLQYSLYAWLLPIGAVIVAIVLDQVWPDFILAPRFGTEICWLNNKWGLVAFFTIPSGLVILINMVLYLASVRTICVQIKSGEMASSTKRKSQDAGKYTTKYPKSGCSADSSSTKRIVSFDPDHNSITAPHSLTRKERFKEKFKEGFQKKHRERLVLYCKLALMMGMTWIFAFVSMHTKSVVCEYFFIILNGLQGAFIFAAFDLKKQVLKDLRSSKGCCRKLFGNPKIPPTRLYTVNIPANKCFQCSQRGQSSVKTRTMEVNTCYHCLVQHYHEWQETSISSNSDTTQSSQENTQSPQENTQSPQENTQSPQENTQSPQENTQSPQETSESEM